MKTLLLKHEKLSLTEIRENDFCCLTTGLCEQTTGQRSRRCVGCQGKR